MSYRIAEVAELTGVPATTIRYYEDVGLISPAARAPNGYRAYDDRDVARLRFVSHARHLDLPVDDLRELVDVWEEDDCAVVASRMRRTVARRLDEAQRRVADVMALAGELQQVLARLQGRPHDGPCVDEECVCLDRMPVPQGVALIPATADGADQISCTLAPEAVPQRLDDWQRLLARATGREPISGGVSVRFPTDPALAADLAAVAAAEHGCCAFLSFALRITADALHLDVTAPPEAAPVVAAVFGIPGRAVAAGAPAGR